MKMSTSTSTGFVLFVILCSSQWQCVPCGLSTGTDRKPTHKKVFPSNFTFGVATAAYQIEGSWNTTDKSESIWDVFCHTSGVDHNETGDDACKSYQYYKRDTQMLAYLGVQFYRLSISWPRILPKGFANEISREGIDHYNSVIDDLLMNAIDPYVTMYHWDLPQCLQDLGGWTNPLIVDWIEEYARVLFENFGDRVKTWITINEPAQIGLGYSSYLMAPGVNAHGIGEYLVAKHVALAHARIWHLYNNEYRQKQRGRVGIVIVADFREPLTDSPEDLQAAQDAMEFDVGLHAHPIYSTEGGFPSRVVQIVAEKSKQQGYPKSRLPDFTDEERAYCKGTADYFGFNHYSALYVTRKSYKPEYDIPCIEDDVGVKTSFLNYTKTASHVVIVPHGIRGALNWIKDTYNNPDILILENGVTVTNSGLLDYEKIDYHLKYLNNVLDAIEKDKVKVFGYTAFSLMDNYEWMNGYGLKFGLFNVNMKDEQRTRQAKLSAIWYRNVIATRTLDPNYVTPFEEIIF